MELVVTQGVCLLSDMPYNQYDITTQPTQKQRDLANQYRSLRYGRLEAGVDAIKVTLASELPVVIGVPTYPDLDNLNESNPIYDTDDGENRGNHAICLIGYDDSLKAFLFINSWGTNRGIKGYGYISYALIEKWKTTGWVLYDAKMGDFVDSEFSGPELTKYVPVEPLGSLSISIPEGITKIGDFAFANQQRLYRITIPDTVTEIGESAFEDCDGLTNVSMSNNLQSIGDYAFRGCSGIESINLPKSLTSIGDLSFKGCYSLSRFNVAESYDQIYFGGSNFLYKKENGKYILIAVGKIENKTTIGGTFAISPHLFEGESALNELEVNGNTYIGDYAFADCNNLEKVYFYADSVSGIGNNAFLNDEFTLYAPYRMMDIYTQAFAEYNAYVTPVPITVKFVKNGEIIKMLNTYYGATILDLPRPYEDGYDFLGWYENEDFTGTVYENGGVWGKKDLTLYANMPPQQFYINFVGEDGESLGDKLVTYDTEIGELPTVTKCGHTFFGWMDEYRVHYYENTVWKMTGNLTLYLDLQANWYTITYNTNGGTPSKWTQDIQYGSVINFLPTAEKEGNTFTHWVTNKDEKWETINVPYKYEIEDDLTLYARYNPNVYSVMFNKQGGSGGSAGVDTTFGEPMPTKDSNDKPVTAPIRDGYNFAGYYTGIKGSGIQYYYADMTSARNWSIAEDAVTLYANWIGKEYEVTLDKQGGTGGPVSVKATFGEAMPERSDITAPTLRGYTFQGYYSEKDGNGTKYYRVNDAYLKSENNWDQAKNSTIYAWFAPNKYTVIFDKQGGTGGSDSVDAFFDQPMTGATKPSCPSNWEFMGYYTGKNGTGTQYYYADMTSANIWNETSATKLYAHYIKYHVLTYKDGNKIIKTEPKVAYGTKVTLLENAVEGYAVWWQTENEQPRREGDSYDMPDRDVTFTISKKEAHVRTLTLNYNNNINSKTTFQVTYGSKKEIFPHNFSAPAGMHFEGWAPMGIYDAAVAIHRERFTNELGELYYPWTLDFDCDMIAVYGENVLDMTDYARSATYTITDSGRFNQPFDSLAYTADFGLSELYDFGYRTIRIKMYIDISEKSDGYQGILVYNGTSESSTYLAGLEINHGGSKKVTSTYTYLVEFDITLTKGMSDWLCIRYGASGVGNDDWYNSNVKIDVDVLSDTLSPSATYSKA